MSIKLTDIIDIRTLQEIQDSFSAATGMAAIVSDADGRPLTRGSGVNDYFNNLLKRSGKANEASKKAAQSGRTAVITDAAGLISFAVPISAEGSVIGTFCGGQALPEPPDDSRLRRAARECNADPDEYAKNARKLAVVPKAKAEAAADMLFTMLDLISGSARSASDDKRDRDLGSIKGNQSEFKHKLKIASDIISDNTRSMHKLSEKFTELKKTSADSLAEVNATKDTVKVIEDVASNTRILGFNASIEASLAKESGKGFGVIAQEVRSLAETSKMSADKIDEAMNTIREYTTKINDNVKSTEEIVDGSLKNMDEFAEVISEIEKMLN